MDPRLRVLHGQVEARTAEIAGGRRWPCRKGCDACCRRLANPPLLTAVEWELLRDGLAGLPPPLRGEVEARIAALPDAGPAVCPMLGEDGACLTYAHRPVACRAYGFYRERERGLCCEEIEARAEAGEWSGVVWGNGEALAARLASFGTAKSLRDWWGRPQ